MNRIFKTIIAAATITSFAHAGSLDNKDFLRQLANPTTYKFNKNLSESICGNNNLQHVSEYDGTKSPVDFVKSHEHAVAALAYGTPNATSSKYCSGTMITEELFLTAGHCIDSGILNEFAVFNYQKKRGSTDLEEQEHFKVIEVVEKSLNGLDYAILKLDGKPGLKYGFTKIRKTAVDAGNALTIIQHPSGNPKMVDAGHKEGERGNYMTYGDVDTEPGSSGSGVLDESGNLIAVHTNGGCYNNSGANAGANSGVLMTEILKASAVIQGLN